MGFVFEHEAATDGHLGLKLELDLTFRDTKTPTLKLTDLHSGHQWLVPAPTISEPITYKARDGWRTDSADVGVRLSTRLLKPIIADLALQQRNRGRSMTDAQATEVFEAALTTFFMRGGEMEKFFPQFRIEWI